MKAAGIVGGQIAVMAMIEAYNCGIEIELAAELGD
jgi:hypothetical protein